MDRRKHGTLKSGKGERGASKAESKLLQLTLPKLQEELGTEEKSS
jgi:hypothetical protein